MKFECIYDIDNQFSMSRNNNIFVVSLNAQSCNSY